MPELPEVETIVRTNRRRIAGRRITAFASTWPRNTLPNAAHVLESIVGRRIERVWRRAKFIVMDLDSREHLLVHLRMSGRFEWAARRDERAEPPHVRAWWTFDDGSRLWFCDARKFGRILLTDDLPTATAGLGVEPLGRAFTPARLAALLGERRRQLKPLLLDQSVIAGLGNIYVDEALHAAGLHPLAPADGLTPPQIERLHAAIRDVLRRAIRANGTSFDWIYPGGRMQEYLNVYGRADQPCRRCGRPIETLRVAQRGTHICPVCQPAPHETGREAGPPEEGMHVGPARQPPPRPRVARPRTPRRRTA